MKRFFLVLATMVVLLPLFFFNVNASPPDSCLMQLPYYYIGKINPENDDRMHPQLFIDTCGIREIWGDQKTIWGDEVMFKNFDTAYYYFQKGGVETQMGDDWLAVDNFYWTIKNMKKLYSTGIYRFDFSNANLFDTVGKDLSKIYYFTIEDISNEYVAIKKRLGVIENSYGKLKFYLSKEQISLPLSTFFGLAYKNSFSGVYVLFDKPVNAFQYNIDNSSITGFTTYFETEFDHTVGIKGNNDFNQILLYPNPVLSALNIHQLDNIQSITIYDIIGTKVYSCTTDFKNSLVIDCSALTNGLYFIKFDDKTTKYFIIGR